MRSISLLPILLCAFVLASPISMAQAWLEDLPGDRSLSFPEVQQRFSDWAKDRDLNEEKGWRWYQRSETFHRQRANRDGSMAGVKPYAEAYMAIKARKNSGTSQLTAATWAPAGPYDLPPNKPGLASGLGRINCVAFHPTDAQTMWVGVGQGGIWKTINGGVSWLPLGDDLPMLRISDIAVDKNDPNTMYICLGDYAYLGSELAFADQYRATYFGMGVMKTSDGGETWQPTGLSFAQTGFDFSLLRRVIIHPQNSQRLIAAGITGVWASQDGGDNWTNVNPLPIWDIEAHPTDPDVLYTSTVFVPTDFSGESSVRKSTDFGASWQTLPTGMPAQFEMLRIELAISASAPENVYAIACGLDQGFHSIWHSADDGATWTSPADWSNTPNILGHGNGNTPGGQGTYDLTIMVHPQNPQEVYIGGINLWGSTDGGRTWDGISDGENNTISDVKLHLDQHFLAYNPLENLFYICNDGGLYSTTEIKIGSWNDIFTQPNASWPTEWNYRSNAMNITSFYRIGLNASRPDALIGGSQDNSTMVKYNGEWLQDFQGDGMECFYSRSNAAGYFGSAQYGFLFKSEGIDGETQSFLHLGIADEGEWVTPFAPHPQDAGGLMAAYGDLWTSDDEGETWSRAAARFARVPGLDVAAASTAMAISADDPDVIYLTKRRYIVQDHPSEAFVTRDGGDSWINISEGLPADLRLSDVEVDDDSPGTAWVTVSSFVENIRVFRTDDFGANWRDISYDLPNLPVNCIMLDQSSDNRVVYVGTDIGVYYSSDDLTEWIPFSDNLPNVIVNELEQHPSTGMIYAATFGRGIWSSEPINSIVSVGETGMPNSLTFKMHPNPNNGQFSLQMLNLDEGASLKIEVVNISGRRVYADVLQANSSSLQHDFALDLPYGAYFMRIKQGPRSQVLRFVVDR